MIFISKYYEENNNKAEEEEDDTVDIDAHPRSTYV